MLVTDRVYSSIPFYADFRIVMKSFLPARDQGVDWSPTATEHVLTYTEGYPYFIHAYGRKTWAQSDTPRITSGAHQAP
jgi:hypothetical protein